MNYTYSLQTPPIVTHSFSPMITYGIYGMKQTIIKISTDNAIFSMNTVHIFHKAVKVHNRIIIRIIYSEVCDYIYILQVKFNNHF